MPARIGFGRLRNGFRRVRMMKWGESSLFRPLAALGCPALRNCPRSQLFLFAVSPTSGISLRVFI